jgi:hypothetical protein
MMKNIVLIGDIVSSKKIPNRQDIQDKIKRVLMELNRENRHLLSPYTLTLGDEFQGVLSRADYLFCDIISILTYVYPIKIRFSIGIGDIQTPINPNQAIGMDGPAFHSARSGIIKLKETSWLFTIVNPYDANQRMVEQSLFLISSMFSKWKQNRFQIMQRLCRDSSVKQIAQNLNITDKAIYKNIDDGGLKIIRELFSEIEGIINRSL